MTLRDGLWSAAVVATAGGAVWVVSLLMKASYTAGYKAAMDDVARSRAARRALEDNGDGGDGL